ncbi:MAG: Fumble domain-containing protein [Anaerolineae bacterium]|nr:Fumble domain-containing protein [Anaerolineae bacterium]
MKTGARRIAIDFGMSNVKVAVAQVNAQPKGTPKLFTLPRVGNASLEEAQRVLGAIGVSTHDLETLSVTGGQAHLLPNQFEQARVAKVSEVAAIGRGGLHLATLDEALVVSAGSGTAMIAARGGGTDCKHVTGSAVGGGTLQGLARLLLNTTDSQEIDALAERGDSNQVDLTLIEATGGIIGSLPVDANAVNFGKLANAGFSGSASREDVAAGLVCLVGQVIAVIAINAAHAERLDRIVIIGNLASLPSVCKVLTTVAGYYGAHIQIAPTPGYGTVLGALLHGVSPIANSQ